MVYNNYSIIYNCLLLSVLSIVQPSVHAAVSYGPAEVESGRVASSAGQLPRESPRPLLQDCPGRNSNVHEVHFFLKYVKW